MGPVRRPRRRGPARGRVPPHDRRRRTGPHVRPRQRPPHLEHPAVRGARRPADRCLRARPGGRVLCGGGFWEREPSPAALAGPDDFGSLLELIRQAEAVGLRPLQVTVADQREWDLFESAANIGRGERWALAHPGHPLHAEVTAASTPGAPVTTGATARRWASPTSSWPPEIRTWVQGLPPGCPDVGGSRSVRHNSQKSQVSWLYRGGKGWRSPWRWTRRGRRARTQAAARAATARTERARGTAGPWRPS
ncbi:hypothetical protein GA0115239_107510 [Streptomyces sp. BpilaLS-43]|nr:hypothetical protein GA0115239_107510 [Streptomyces sp. BpilaLS-43]